MMINLLQDIKILDGINGNSAISRIMKRYALEKGDYENSNYVEKINKALEWNESPRDIITPFWKTFSAALVYTANQYELVRGRWKEKNVNETYVLIENNIWYRTFFDKRDLREGTPLSKAKLGKRYMEENETHKGFVDKTVEIFPELEELASISDSFSNCSPCPEQPFNSLKGLLPDICDFLNLFVDKVQECVDKNVGLVFDNLSVDINEIKKWHVWLKTNREKFFLQDYYYVEGGRLHGKPLFPEQSLLKPLPTTEEEIRMCIGNELRILKNRAELITKSRT